MPFAVNYRQVYSPYTDYVNGRGGKVITVIDRVLLFSIGFYGPPGGFYGAPHRGINDLSEQEGFPGYPKRGNRGYRGGRGRGGQRNQAVKSDKFVCLFFSD